jgi:hypothetical protein
MAHQISSGRKKINKKLYSNSSERFVSLTVPSKGLDAEAAYEAASIANIVENHISVAYQSCRRVPVGVRVHRMKHGQYASLSRIPTCLFCWYYSPSLSHVDAFCVSASLIIANTDHYYGQVSKDKVYLTIL